MFVRFLFLLISLHAGIAICAGAELTHCGYEPSGPVPCKPADHSPVVPLAIVSAIGPAGDTIQRAEKLLYHILSGEQVGKSKTIEFQLYDISGGNPVYKDHATLNPDSSWYSCWVSFTYFITGKYRMVALADSIPVAEDTFEIIGP